MFSSVMTSHLNFMTQGTVSNEHLSHETLQPQYVHCIVHMCTNSRCQVTHTTEFCMVVHNISRSSIWNLLHITFLVPRIFLHFWKICALLHRRSNREERYNL